MLLFVANFFRTRSRTIRTLPVSKKVRASISTMLATHSISSATALMLLFVANSF